MLSHYLSTAFRNLSRRKTHTLINVFGLGMGLACFIAAYIFIDYVRRTDTHFPNYDRTYSVFQSTFLPVMDLEFPFEPGSSAVVAAHLRAELPRLEAVARSTGASEAIVALGDDEWFREVGYVDPDFLRIFELPFIYGSPESAATQSRAAILTEETATLLFGTPDVVGRTIELRDRGSENPDQQAAPYTSQIVAIAGVIEQIPEPSHLGVSLASEGFDLFIVTTIEEDIAGSGVEFFADPTAAAWIFSNTNTYVLLPADGSVTPELLNERLGVVAGRAPEEFVRLELEARQLSDIAMAGLNEILLYSQAWLSVGTLILLLGGAILVTACVNFISLSTAAATSRTKEVGMRKVLGAKRAQITSQHLLEAGLVVVAAHAIALLMLQAALPVVNEASEMTFAIPWLTADSFWLFLLLLAMLVTVSSGGYPALVLGRVRPVRTLGVSAPLRPSRVRAILVGVQFATTSFLLIGVIVVLMQNAALAREGLGLSTDPYVVIQDRPRAVGITQEALRAALLEAPQVLEVTGASRPPWMLGWGGSVYSSSPEEAAEITFTQERRVAYNYLPSLGVELLAGRWFSEADAERHALATAAEAAGEAVSGDDDVPETGDAPEEMPPVILNRTAVQQFGWTDPEEAVGGIIYNAFRTPERTVMHPLEVIGVVDEEPFALVGFGYDAFVFSLADLDGAVPVIRISSDDVSGALAHIDAVWSRLVPNSPIRRQFMDERFDEAYSFFERLSQGLLFLAGCAIVITNMGLFGMAIFTVGRRQREVGVRKCMGARMSQILSLFIRDFSKPLIIANVIAWPFAYFVAQAYLNIFIQRIPLTPAPFLLGLVITLIIAWLAVAGQVFRSARVSPAEVLRYE